MKYIPLDEFEKKYGEINKLIEKIARKDEQR